jgi:tRNA-binding protein
MITWEDFEKIDVRVGKIIEINDFPEAKIPSYKMVIDFGSEIGIKKSCGRYPQNYKKDELLGRQILGVVNFPPRQIGPAVSEVLVLGVYDEKESVVLVLPEREVQLGSKLG